MIHKFSMKGTNIVVDVNSGAVHVFDDLSYEILDYYKKYDNEKIIEMLSDRYDKLEIKEALEEIQSLEKDGQLYSEDIYKDHLPVGDAKPVVKALCLHISHDCNLRCKYCFASTGDFGRHRSVMSPEVGKKAIDFLLRESGGRRNLEVDFFGGEPLLNFDTVKEIVNYALEKEKEYNKHFRFTITTNAVLLNEDHKKFINEHMSNVVLSIDGRPEVNDRMRFRIDGTGTYKDILPKIKDMAESRNQTNYYVRGTFTRENLDFSKDVIHLADQGFKQISVEPVVAAKDSGYDLREEDLPVLFEEYEKLAYEYVKRQKEGNGFNFFHFMIDLNQGPCIAKRITGCGAGHEYLAITPEGDIYPCHQFVGMDDFKMGTVMDGKLNTGIQNYFSNSNVYTKKECMQCWARFYCSGGCAANEYQFNGDINVPYKVGCELEKKRVECALWIKTQE
ncbi:thioether cross-link-forming SCIFF peptide maturase [Clostridium thermosuccinogenes]|uniref:Thioether cross-link-forming SCIFF peptide maturase n=1 Tax=Clostridium thermosuccinogenes TaxID=84032 RepID=A0A2K2FAN9_9CLOT|nr:thioether cross-link-forming SCIFF peptide maturase [Pseudoclostridium thermosuccinogenes]AUS98729.1 thioether cross-link-forming SCIFF peptide maturase [Pseudoclostridium thermosuccinogenes]PNT95106.1 thioether cross-link-forming SCIFF peptide maturase [Pseudoclostridium thermosuccinogenes]PNT95853.1 thioether cross-link-forming SCIFF peptide maturase [Pseudoclostridium thermosuccinogenes]